MSEINLKGDVSGQALELKDDVSGRALVRNMSPAQIVRTLRTTPSVSGRAGLLELVPTDTLAAVLLQDERVFVPEERRRLRLEVPQGHIEPLTYEEQERLVREGYGKWVVVTGYSEVMANPIAWGYRSFLYQFNSNEALERLVAILESGNEGEWKQTALRAMSVEYIALAIRDAEEEGSGMVELIKEIDEEIGHALHAALRETQTELFMRAMETRESRLAEMQEAIVLTEEAAEVMENLANRSSSRDLLAELRAGTPGQEK